MVTRFDRMAVEPDYSILSAFQGPISRPKKSPFYVAGLLLVAGTMLLLPVIYVAMALAIAYAVGYHAVHDFQPIMGAGEGGGLYVHFALLLIYMTPIFAGSVVVFFMFKPLLAGRPRRAQPLALNPASERLLYAFIEKVCDTVGAPSPKRIDLDCQLNAAAGFRRGVFSMFGSDLVLVLGLPLVANLTAQELAGIIAHEFGHFTQGAGMRLSYIINRINSWFWRVAYERDAWDEALERSVADSRDGRVALFIWLVQIAVWFSRLILKLLLYFGVLVGGFMRRQKEYDADAYEIKVAGSECFERTMRKLATLDAAWQSLLKHLDASWRKTRTLPDNLPQMLRGGHERIPAPVLQKIDDSLGFQRTGVFDSHPSPADRIRQARRANEPGIFHDQRPASSLFSSFEHPSRFVTLLHYTDDIGLPITEQMLTHVAKVQTEEHKRDAAADRDAYFLGILPQLKPIRLQAPVASSKLEADYGELAQLATGLRQTAEQLKTFAKQDIELQERLVSSRVTQVLLNNRYGLRPGTLAVPQSDLDAAAASEAEALKARLDLRHSLREVGPALIRRLEMGLSLALANVGQRSLSEDDKQAIPALVEALNQKGEIYAQQQELAEALMALTKINQTKAADGENPALRRALDAQEHAIHALAARFGAPPVATLVGAEAPRLQIAKSSADLALVRQRNQEWFQEYDRVLTELVRLAVSVESFAPA